MYWPTWSRSQAALDAALRRGASEQAAERRFEIPVHFADFADFERRMMRRALVDHHLDDAKLAAARAVFDPQCDANGASFVRPTHVRLLRRCD